MDWPFLALHSLRRLARLEVPLADPAAWDSWRLRSSAVGAQAIVVEEMDLGLELAMHADPGNSWTLRAILKKGEGLLWQPSNGVLHAGGAEGERVKRCYTRATLVYKMVLLTSRGRGASCRVLRRSQAKHAGIRNSC